jgi:formamidopyrimidine-DNA glycosylase
MPEGGEVKLTVDFLNQKLSNKRITLEVLGGRYTRHTMKNLDKIKFPLKVKSVNCKGKFIYFLFKNTEISLWVTLGMSGHFIEKNEEGFRYTTKKHNNIAIHYNNNTIYYHDYRNFGNWTFSLKKEELEQKLQTIGMDLLDLDTNFKDFYDIIVKKRNNTIIAELLLEQKYFSGIGNYARADALYLAKINPFKLVKDIPKNDVKRLFYWIRVVLFYHYNVKYGLSNGVIKEKDLKKLPKGGGNGLEFNRDFVIYRKEKDRYGNLVNHVKDSNGRTIHYVKEIQCI